MKFTTDAHLMKLAKYDAVIFDLDNTLYDERDYLFAAYNEIATRLAETSRLSREEVFRFLTETFTRNGRSGLFDAMVKQFGLPAAAVIDALRILRSCTIAPPIELFPFAAALLEGLMKQAKKVFILTNGNPEQQRNKIASIRWPQSLPDGHIYLANVYEKKPSPAAVHQLLRDHNLAPGRVAMIGDADTDAACAAGAGVDYYSVDEFSNSEQNG